MLVVVLSCFASPLYLCEDAAMKVWRLAAELPHSIYKTCRHLAEWLWDCIQLVLCAISQHFQTCRTWIDSNFFSTPPTDSFVGKLKNILRDSTSSVDKLWGETAREPQDVVQCQGFPRPSEPDQESGHDRPHLQRGTGGEGPGVDLGAPGDAHPSRLLRVRGGTEPQDGCTQVRREQSCSCSWANWPDSIILAG